MTCQEFPRAASGLPGIHHARPMAFADLYARYAAMRGLAVPREAALSCHGMSVEVAVERGLGLAGGEDIAAYGIAGFTARCREYAIRHADVHSAFALRLGCLPRTGPQDLTMDAARIEAIWQSLRRFYDAGLLVRAERVGPYCPRCQTPLDDREPARGAQAGRPAGGTSAAGYLTVRLGLRALPAGANPHLRGADLLVRTRAAWTLPAYCGVAVHPRASYVVARRAGQDDRVVVAEAVLGRVLGEGWHVAARVSGTDLAGAACRPAFGPDGTPSGTGEPGLDDGHGAFLVVASRVVEATRGTGLFPLAPAFGAPDLAVAREHGLPVVSPIRPDGRFDPRTPLVGGMFFADADAVLTESLAERGLLFGARSAGRRAPTSQRCPWCGSPLLWRARTAWHLRTADSRTDSGTDGRTDSGTTQGPGGLTVSRSRYWGTPLPVWECERSHVTCAGSLAELSGLAGRDLRALDPHRPYVDKVIIGCPRCGAPARRVPDVLDGWLDTVLPALTPSPGPGRPARPASSAPTAPQDGAAALVIVADAEQARSWNSVALAATALGPRPAAAVCRLGPVTDEQGRPMRQARGNVAGPLPLIDRHGADAVRWLLTATRPPCAAVRVSDAALTDITRSVLRSYWHAVALLARAGAAPSWPPRGAPLPGDRPALDRWLLSELQSLVAGVTEALDALDPATAGRRIRGFVGDLTRWYIRRSRRRLTATANPVARAAALATLHTSLEALTRLIAPVTPFLADQAWSLLRTPGSPAPVHRAEWPVPDPDLADPVLADQMALTRRAARLGRAARAAAGIPNRQPLARALVMTGGAQLPAELRTELAGELNVAVLDTALLDTATGTGPLPGWTMASRAGLTVALDGTITPELRRGGIARHLIRLVQDARARDGLIPGDPVALRWRCDDAGTATDIAAALAEHAGQIRSLAQVITCGPLAAGNLADGVEHYHERLGLTFSLGPVADP